MPTAISRVLICTRQWACTRCAALRPAAAVLCRSASKRINLRLVFLRGRGGMWGEGRQRGKERRRYAGRRTTDAVRSDCGEEVHGGGGCVVRPLAAKNRLSAGREPVDRSQGSGWRYIAITWRTSRHDELQPDSTSGHDGSEGLREGGGAGRGGGEGARRVADDGAGSTWVCSMWARQAWSNLRPRTNIFELGAARNAEC